MPYFNQYKIFDLPSEFRGNRTKFELLWVDLFSLNIVFWLIQGNVEGVILVTRLILLILQITDFFSLQSPDSNAKGVSAFWLRFRTKHPPLFAAFTDALIWSTILSIFGRFLRLLYHVLFDRGSVINHTEKEPTITRFENGLTLIALGGGEGVNFTTPQILG